MPKLSIRKPHLNEIDAILFQTICQSDEDDDLLEYRFAISSSRFICGKTSIPKTIELRNLLWNLPEVEFQQVHFL